MQTVETLNEGLRRAYALTIPAADIAARVDAELKTIAPKMRMPGFRPGKVPPNLVRKMHGAAMEQDALDKAVREGVQAVITDNSLRPAMQPAVKMDEDWETGKDVAISIDVEVLPEIDAIEIEGLTLDRLTVEPGEDAVDEALGRIAGARKSFEDAEAGRAAALGDLVVMDFDGTIDGEAFEGGTGEAASVELGSGQMIPGFEDQLVGLKAGDTGTVEVNFPADYAVERLAGRAARFEVRIGEVRAPKADAAPDDAFAQSLGLEGLDQLRGLLRDQIVQELNMLTRTHMKRQLLDRLAATHDFPVPPSMVDAEFDQIWRQLEHEAGHEADPEAARKEMEDERDDYRRIAERRVRLGLLLSEIGQRNDIRIAQQEMNQLIAQAAQQYPAEERERFMEYVRNEPMAAAQLRAPLYEDKVVDYLFDKATITDRGATRAELEAEIEAEEGHVHGPGCAHDHDEPAAELKPKPKRKATKQAASKPAATKPAASKPAASKRAAPKPAAPEPAASKPTAVKSAASKSADAKTAEAPKPAVKGGGAGAVVTEPPPAKKPSRPRKPAAEA